MSTPTKTEPMKLQCENHEKCMQMIQAIIDGSATSDEIEHFKANMTSCLPCMEGYEEQKKMKEMLQGKVEKKCCPEATVRNIKAKLGITVLLIGCIVAVICK